MRPLTIITPIKDSIALSLETAKAILSSDIRSPYHYTIYNDFSMDENTIALEHFAASHQRSLSLVNLSDITSHPSPNYLLVLQLSQRQALMEDADLLIVESDVVVRPDTIQSLVDGAAELRDCGIAAAVTVDEMGEINYPYEYARDHKGECYAEKRHCSFCCSLLTNALLKACNFKMLNPDKHWFDVAISQQSRALGFTNYLFANHPVIHRPHASRPWKRLKYTNPMKYYWIKFTKGYDKI